MHSVALLAFEFRMNDSLLEQSCYKMTPSSLSEQ